MDELVALGTFFAAMSLLAIGSGNTTVPAILNHSTSSGWVSHDQFLYVYSIGQVAPGPSTMYVAGIGYIYAGVAGALVAGFSFVVPSSILVAVFTHGWTRWRHEDVKATIAAGLTPVAAGLLAASVYKLITTTSTITNTVTAPHVFTVLLLAVVALTVGALTQWTKLHPAILVVGSGVIATLGLSFWGE